MTKSTPTPKIKKIKPWTTNDADDIFSKWIRQRDPFCYFNCGRPSTQNSHFWGRGASSTRYDPLNCDGICGKCHFTHEGNKQGLYREKKIGQLTLTGYRLLMQKHYKIMQRSDSLKELQSWLAPYAKKVQGKWTVDYALYTEKVKGLSTSY